MRAAIFGLLLFVGIASAQTAQPPAPSFEVASVKPASPDERVTGPPQDSVGSHTARDLTVRSLIERAYQMQPYQVSGGPEWINSEKFDIDAKVDEATARQLQTLSPDDQFDQKSLMLRSLLSDRFNL